MRYYKRVFLSAVLAILFVPAKSQLRVAPEIGVNYGSIKREIANTSGLGVSVTNSTRVGLRAGAIVDVKLAGGLHLQPGVFYMSRSTVTSIDVLIIKITQKFAVNYLEVPLNFQYNLDLPIAGKVFIGAGPYMGYVLGGNAYTEVDAGFLQQLGGVAIPDEEHNITTGTDSTNDIKPFDIGLAFNAGYEAKGGLFIRAQYGFGLTNTMPIDNMGTQKTWAGCLTVGYLIGLNRKK